MSDGNGENAYGVTFGRIMFLQQILQTHTNIASNIRRHSDIVYEVTRVEQRDELTIVCVDAYSASLELVMRVVTDFPGVNIIFVGGKWNGVTSEAGAFCRERKIGICNAGEISRALRKTKYWED